MIRSNKYDRKQSDEMQNKMVKMKINSEGRIWVKAKGVFSLGGDWLVGRCIRVLYNNKTWYPGIVTGYDPQSKSGGLASAPMHDVQYADGSYLEDLSNGKWEYDACEGGGRTILGRL